MRVSMQSGRKGNPRHNDRSFLRGLTLEEQLEIAPHIDSSKDCIKWTVDGKGRDFEEAELEFYRKTYGEAREVTNSRYEKQRHPEKCRTIEQDYRAARTRPEEVILQIGDRDSKIDPKTFLACVNSFLSRLSEWNRSHGNHLHILTIAIHLDESTPHAHVRRVWDYVDKKGYTRIGQNKALEAAGIGLPHPGKPVSRYNNRKMVFDQEMRSMWQHVCQEHSLKIETEPLPGRRRHKEVDEYKASKMRQEIQALDRAIQERRELLQQVEQVIGSKAQLPDFQEVMQRGRDKADLARLRKDHPELFDALGHYDGCFHSRDDGRSR